MTVPSGFTTDNLPVGITFFGRPYSEPTLAQAGLFLRAGDASSRAAEDHPGPVESHG